MKRVFLATAVFLVAGVIANAQVQPPTSAETRQQAQQALAQGRTSASQFESTLADLNARNTGNSEAAALRALRAEIGRLEAAITADQTRIRSALDNGTRLGSQLFSRVRRLMDRHAERLSELEIFIARQ